MLEQITNVWTGILTWLTTSMASLQAVFYDTSTSSLTFLGILAVIGVAIGVCMYIFQTVKDFLRLR